MNKILIFLLLIVIIIAVYEHNKNNKDLNMIKQQLNSNQNVQPKIIQEIQETQRIQEIQRIQEKLNQESQNNINIRVVEKQPSSPFRPLRDYDYRALADPLVPPLKRDDWNIPIIPIPTRGYPTAFKKMGMLIDETAINTDPYKFLLLIGRQKYQNSNWYEYYAIEKNMSEGSLKFDLPKIRREIMDGDIIKIDPLNKTYKAVLDRNLSYEYSPFLY